MKPQSFWKISARVLPESEDAAADLFLNVLGQSPSSYTDVETGETTVSVYLARKPGWPQIRRVLADGLKRINACGLETGPGEISIQKLPRQNWAESWKRHFKPIEIGGRLLIKPSWSKQRRKKNQAVLVLDPGLSFGTGQHPTTSFCLEQLVAFAGERKGSFLDIGTGSGILAIAAAKLGFRPIEAFDFDPECIRVSTRNARRNRVADRLRIRPGDVTKLPRRTSEKFDMICANLISNLLISERARIAARLKPGGLLVLAGILSSEFAGVRRAYEAAGFRLAADRVHNEWQSGAFTRIGE